MKAVLINEWKIFKYYFLASILGLVLIFLIFINNIESDNRFFIYCIGIVTYTLRGQIIFGDKYSDMGKFLTMPVSINDYALGKIIRNIMVYIITSMAHLISLAIFRNNITVEILIRYIFYFLSIDFSLMSIFHVFFSKYKKSYIFIIYILSVLLVGMPLLRYTKYLLNYKIIFIILSIALPVISVFVDYKFSSKLLKENEIVWKQFYIMTLNL